MNAIDCAVWETTLACNMNCKHCGSSAGTARANELKTKECYQLCEDLASCNCETVSLMGGEPFVRDDWHLIAQCVKDLGMELAFVTNGLVMNQVISKLARLEPCVVGISLDGLEQTHDSIRRKGSYKAATQAIDLLTEHNIPVTVITTISKTNFKELPKIRDIIKPKGVNWQIQIAMPFGNFDSNLLISEEEYYASAMFIASEGLKNRYRDNPTIGAHCYGYFSHLLPGGSKHWKGCTAGISTVGITSDGGICGCLSISNQDYIEGNIRDRSFTEIWEDPNSFAYNRKFTTDKLGPYCKDCYYGKICKGGCDSVSLHLTGNFHNDPLCFRRIEEQQFDVKPSWKERIMKKLQGRRYK